MKKGLLVKIGAGFLTGSILALAPLATAQAADHSLYDSLQELSDGMKLHRTGDVYEYMEPTASGMQGPVRTDMMKDDRGYYSGSGAYASEYYGSAWTQWSDIRTRLGPVGGEGTN
ncbi:hypothetical protein [Zoogloea sp.]|uniref:hypothetical protein n=1 Tax=Zoogloea sp. TaxID=49181 RepID=UPI00262D85B5|nr:hypothetical protein [Zoogloea sp.]